ncbi:MAG: sigma-70 family RNA polymerase sigma factor [Planctomyces sp.]|nr:sigma-70 family RNA polymerase sigma factor [Planctomyces sp.]
MDPAAAPQNLDDDDQLMVRLQGGDASAFDELVERHQGPLCGFFFRNTRDRQLAEDLTQDTLLKVYHQFWDYLPSGRFRGWMFRIARNLLIDDVRRKRHDALIRAVKGSTADEPDILHRIAEDIVPPEVHVEEREFTSLVNALLEEIPRDQRETFTLHHFSGLSLPEISDAMDVPLATSKSRLRLAREKLSEKLAARGMKGPPGAESRKTIEAPIPP